MALATTTLSAAVSLTDTSIILASAASIASGRILRIDDEIMQVAQGYVSGTTVNVLRGRDGSATQTHVLTANVTHGLASDFSVPAATVEATYVPQRPRKIVSITATTATLALPPAGTDMMVVLNGTAAITLTVPVPTQDMDGNILWLVSNGVAQHVYTFTSGFGGVGSGYTTATPASGARGSIMVIACNGFWNAISGPGWSGTVTKATCALA